jgi:hypothetical protein
MRHRTAVRASGSKSFVGRLTRASTYNRTSVFQAHVELLHSFLAHRGAIVESLQSLLNAQRKPADYLQNGPLLADHIEECFFALAGTTHQQSRLRGRLESAHWAHGFKPRVLTGLHNGLIDPAEMMVRAFHLWQQTRWPGRNGRVRYAHTLFNLSVLRDLELLSMRLWDDAPGSVSERLSHVQAALDQLWNSSPADQPVLVRDARWLIPLAQSPATDDLGAYFAVARNVADTVAEAERIEIHRAGVVMAAGHLRSQIRYHSLKRGVTLADAILVRNTRNTNALDFALLIQDLVPLLGAYEQACEGSDRPARLALADAILQGVSPDPELFLNRVELLGAYSMLEHLFVTTGDDGPAAYTPMGQRHVGLFHEYEARIGRVSASLAEDATHFRPAAGTYSPYGAMYGFSTDLLEHMAFKTLQSDTVSGFALEDVFTAGEADKLAWVSGWRKLPHLPRDVQQQFDYPQAFAEAVFERIEAALGRRVSDHDPIATRTGRVFILPAEATAAEATHRAESYDQTQLSSDRREGRCLLSYQAPGGWVAISKRLLTDELAAGRDVKIAGLPPAAADVLTLMCPSLVNSRTRR